MARAYINSVVGQDMDKKGVGAVLRPQPAQRLDSIKIIVIERVVVVFPAMVGRRLVWIEPLAPFDC
jgi:hypothetical protein